MPFGWGDSEKAYDQVYQNDNFEENKSSFGHELIAGGAAFAGFKAFEDHQRKEGKPVSHQFAKELLAGFAVCEPSISQLYTGDIYYFQFADVSQGAEVDKLAETKGEDWFDKEKAKHQAKQNAERLYDEHYVDNQGADQYNPNQYGPPQHFERRGW